MKWNHQGFIIVEGGQSSQTEQVLVFVFIATQLHRKKNEDTHLLREQTRLFFPQHNG